MFNAEIEPLVEKINIEIKLSGYVTHFLLIVWNDAPDIDNNFFINTYSKKIFSFYLKIFLKNVMDIFINHILYVTQIYINY